MKTGNLVLMLGKPSKWGVAHRWGFGKTDSIVLFSGDYLQAAPPTFYDQDGTLLENSTAERGGWAAMNA